MRNSEGEEPVREGGGGATEGDGEESMSEFGLRWAFLGFGPINGGGFLNRPASKNGPIFLGGSVIMTVSVNRF